MSKTLLAALALAALLAGCAGDGGVQSVDRETANVEFEGRDSGEHSDSAECDDDATLAGSGNIEDGNIQVTVTDGSGATRYQETYDGGVETDGERMEGASGSWTLTVVRSGDDVLGDEFNGQYAFTLTC